MSTVESERGYLIVAQNNVDTDYIKCARMLAHSIKLAEPQAKICLLTDSMSNASQEFDYVKTFPFGDRSGDNQWKLHNDWQCFYASPFRQTIKLEADMIVPLDISHWFDVCACRDVVVTIGARNYHNDLSDCRDYRRIFDINDLPDAYNAVTYWRLSQTAKIFFDTVKTIFEHWPDAMSALKYGKDQPINTDLAYAIAIKLLGEEKHTLPGTVPGLIHMKSGINALVTDDWTHELVWEISPGSFRINTIEQMWPFHYHVKDFANHLENAYGRIR